MGGPINIAQEKGFFKEQGVNTKILFTTGTTRAFKAYLQGKADATTINSLNIARSNINPSDHVIIGTLCYSDNQLKLLARKSAGINRVADLKGKKIAVHKASFAHFYLEKFLLFNGLALNDVEEVFASKKEIPGVIERGMAHATMQHGVPIAKTKKILGEDHVIFQNPDVHTKTQHLMVSRKWLTQHREQAKEVLRALVKGEEFIKAHIGESIEILAKAKEFDVSDMAHSVRHEMNYDLSLKQSIFTELEGMEQWALDNSLVKRKIPRNYLEMIDYSLLEEIDPKRVTIIR
ncbi:MAG: ABC transporter substrate-binding protein [Desulfobacter sp.]